MPCEPLYDANGRHIGWACSRERTPRCSVCRSRPGTLLCDYPLRGPKAGTTCDRRLCERCATKHGTLDLCPVHAELAAKEGDHG